MYVIPNIDVFLLYKYFISNGISWTSKWTNMLKSNDKKYAGVEKIK